MEPELEAAAMPAITLAISAMNKVRHTTSIYFRMRAEAKSQGILQGIATKAPIITIITSSLNEVQLTQEEHREERGGIVGVEESAEHEAGEVARAE